MNLIKKRILITAGEPASISSEITIKAIKKLNKESTSELILITDPSLIKQEIKNLQILLYLKQKIFNFIYVIKIT